MKGFIIRRRKEFQICQVRFCCCDGKRKWIYQANQLNQIPKYNPKVTQ